MFLRNAETMVLFLTLDLFVTILKPFTRVAATTTKAKMPKMVNLNTIGIVVRNYSTSNAMGFNLLCSPSDARYLEAILLQGVYCRYIVTPFRCAFGDMVFPCFLFPF